MSAIRHVELRTQTLSETKGVELFTELPTTPRPRITQTWAQEGMLIYKYKQNTITKGNELLTVMSTTLRLRFTQS